MGAPLGELKFFICRRDRKHIFEGNTITFLMPRTTLRGFFAILTTHRRNLFITSEGLLRPGALASIGLTEGASKNRAAYSNNIICYIEVMVR